MADLDADLEDFMHVATDGNYNLKILNDAFEGRGHENEEIDLVTEGGEVKVKKRTKRPPIVQRPQAKTASAAFGSSAGVNSKKKLQENKQPQDPRVKSLVEDVMRRSA